MREPTSSSRPPSARVAVACVVLMCLIWGSTWLVVRRGLEDLPPFTSAGLRFAVASLAMTFVAPRLSRLEGGRPPTWRLRLTMGGLNFTLSYAIVYWCEQRLPSGLVSVLWATFPMMMAISGRLFLPDERLLARQWGGFALALVGVLLLFVTDLSRLGPAAIPAALVLLVSPAASAIGNTFVKRDGQDVSSVLLNRDGLYVGTIGLLSGAWLFERDLEPRWTPAAIGSILYLALAGTVVAFGLYFWLMRYLPATRLSLITYIIPVVALTLGALFGDEAVGWTTGGGLLAILAGVALGASRGERGASPATGAD